MNILTGQQLVNSIRKDADKIKSRLWITVPFIGGVNAVSSIIGKNWIENPSISVKLITDTTDINNFNSESLELFLKRGIIKNLPGVHAKIYLLDDVCYLTSANLTHTAFAKRYEFGFRISGNNLSSIEKLFKNWWAIAKPVKNIEINRIINSKGKKSKEEKQGQALPIQWKLPKAPNLGRINLKKKFLDYPRVMDEYEKFAEMYKKIQRIWPRYPLYLEIDVFLNYLYHEAPHTPSNFYRDNPTRKLSEMNQKAALKKYAILFKNYVRGSENRWHIKQELESSRIINSGLSKGKIKNAAKKDFKKIFDRINSLNSYPINKTRIFNNNPLEKIRTNLSNLIHGDDILPARMNKCSEIRFMGTSTINEIIGYYDPKKFPIVNRNSSAGLRFFGFNIPTYR